MITNEQIAHVANLNEAFMDGTTSPIVRILSENDLVFACWHDTTAENGVSTLILKGKRKLSTISSEASPAPEGTLQLRRGAQQLLWSSVKVLNFEMAIAARETLGESEGLH